MATVSICSCGWVSGFGCRGRTKLFRKAWFTTSNVIAPRVAGNCLMWELVAILFACHISADKELLRKSFGLPHVD